MAQDKKSVLMYVDIIATVMKLEDAEAGRLWKHYLQYVNDLNPEAPDRLTEIMFEPIKQQLKRDLKKWESVRLKRVEAGAKGGKQKVANAKKDIANVAVTVNVNDKVIVNDKKNNIEERKLAFADTLKPFLEKYGRDLLKEFYNYWTEPNKSNTKMRWELQKTWSVNLRLETWARNDKNFQSKGPSNNTPGQVIYKNVENF